MTLILTVKDRDSNTKEYTFSDEKRIILCGRKETNDILIQDKTVSLHHFKIVLENGKYFIEDENSTNGTFLNGKRITRAEIKDNDIIYITLYTIKVRITKLNIPKAEISVLENPFDDRKKFTINKTLTFIGTSQKADIPAKPKNIYYPISDFSLAIILKENKYIAIPVNKEVTKINSLPNISELELKSSDIIEVGITRFEFKYL
jgi:pSer/pThr/pTyr-binding forkhead associated (FHA) protein